MTLEPMQLHTPTSYGQGYRYPIYHWGILLATELLQHKLYSALGRTQSKGGLGREKIHSAIEARGDSG